MIGPLNQRSPLLWILPAGGIALFVIALLVMEWRQSDDDLPAHAIAPTPAMSPGKAFQATTGSESPIREAFQAPPAGSHPDVLASSLGRPVQQTDVESDPEPTPQPLPTPAVYANPESLGEVSEQDEEMYRRVVDQLAEKMSTVTDRPDSPAYFEKFHQASEEADNNLRALMGNDAFLRMQSAASHGETAQ
jgi:hypothetical protein